MRHKSVFRPTAINSVTQNYTSAVELPLAYYLDNLQAIMFKRLQNFQI